MAVIEHYPPNEPVHITRGSSGTTFCGQQTHRVLASMPYEKWIRLASVPEPCADCLREVQSALSAR